MQVGVKGGSGSFGVRRCWMIALATAARAVTAPVTALMISEVAVESSILFVLLVARPFTLLVLLFHGKSGSTAAHHMLIVIRPNECSVW